jgi:hypothetical protein
MANKGENDMWPETKRRIVLIARLLKNQQQRMLPLRATLAACLLLLGFAGVILAQSLVPQSTPSDPGVRGGTVDAGRLLASVASTPGLLDFASSGSGQFQEDQVVQGAANNGLGPRFNSNSCSSCHSQPAVGGTSPSQTVFPHVGPNPETQVFNLDGARNVLPSFITPDGPVREVRFKFFLNPDGSLSSRPDGGVHDLFTIAGRFDASSCAIGQPNFARHLALGNVIFRIPTPVFGA